MRKGLLMLVAVWGFCAFSSQAEAGTFGVGDVTYTVSLNKASYVAGSNMNISGRAVTPSCGNAMASASLDVNIDGRSKEILASGYSDSYTYSNSVSMRAPSVPGTYTAVFTGTGERWDCSRWDSEGDCIGEWTEVPLAPKTYNINFTVTAGPGQCGAADGGSFSSAPSGSSLCMGGTANPIPVATNPTSYTWSCVGSTTVPCSANRILPVADPVFTPGTGTYTSVQSVEITTATAGATIYYALGGIDPTTSSSIYTGPISVSSTSTIKALATKSGFTPSNITTAIYTLPLKIATPVFAPGAGTYGSAQNVSISTTTPGATIHYTTNGSAPSTSSPVYSSPISVTSTKTLRAFAVKSGMTDSDFANALYTIGAVPPPLPPSATCSDGIQNGTETGVDCGGSCPACSSPSPGTTDINWREVTP